MKTTTQNNRPAGRRSRGYSLVELLVSGALTTLAVSITVAAVTAGSALSTIDNNRRQARSIVRSVIEQQYNYADYNVIPSSLDSTSAIEIDPRLGNSLSGQLTQRVTLSSIVTENGTTVLAKLVTVAVKWAELGNVCDSIILTKMIAKAL